MAKRSISDITYKAPPLVEVAMSAQFDPPKGLTQAHLGVFWDSLKGEFPSVRAIQPIAPVNEVFGGQGQWLPPSLQLALTNEPDCRLQMASRDDQWMLQIQRDRLVINWRKRGDQYPRFDATLHRFREAWQRWSNFAASVGAELKPRIWEITYVNRVPKRNLWESPLDWPSVFPGLWGSRFTTVGEAGLCGFQGQWVWESSSPPSRLYVEPKPARSTDQPNEDVLLLTLTARGIVERSNGDSPLEGIAKGISFGHELIVECFDNLASAAAKKVWERYDDSN